MLAKHVVLITNECSVKIFIFLPFGYLF